MEKKIFKYGVPVQTKVTVTMTKGAEVLCVMWDSYQEHPVIYALVNPLLLTEVRYFDVFETGEDIPFDIGIERRYIGSIRDDKTLCVYHLFERIN